MLTSDDIPYRSTLVFNAGVTCFHGKYVMIFRNDYSEKGKVNFYGTNLGLAVSEDGISFTVAKKAMFRRTYRRNK